MGGFSYADVLESAKGWAGTIRHNSGLWAAFQAFYARPDTWCASSNLCRASVPAHSADVGISICFRSLGDAVFPGSP